jgi:hypothetical protein
MLGAGVSLGAMSLCALSACFSSTSSSSNDAGSQEQTSSDSASPVPTSTGTASGPGPSAEASAGTTLVAITPDSGGYVGPSSNSLGIQGAWYGYGDDWGTNGAPPGDCEVKGMHMTSQCSSITFPLPAMVSDAGGDAGAVAAFPQTTPGTMCLSGTAAKVIGSDYSNMFGIGIGIDLNNQAGVKMPYNASMNNVVGFSFHISGIPSAAAVRVEIPIPATDASGDAWSITAAADGDYTFDLNTMASDAHSLKPSFTPPAGTTQPAFDATMIKSIQFHIPTNVTSAITIPDSARLCVSNLQAIVKAP